MINKSFLLRDSEHTYAPLFVIAILYCIFGTFVWPLSFYFNIQSENIFLFHKLFMFGGFLSSFADGFFLTAFPGFTRTKRINNLFLILILILKALVFLSLFIDNIQLGLMSYLVSVIFVLTYGVRRYLSRDGVFPISLYFVFAGMFNSLLYFSIKLYELKSNVTLDSATVENLIQVFFPINLMMGVGLKIIPVFFGLPVKNCFSIKKNRGFDYVEHFRENRPVYYLLFFNLTIVFDMLNLVIVANLLRLCILSLIFINHFQIQNPPKVLSFVTIGMRISLWFVLIGMLLRCFESAFIFGTHIYFIGGVVSFTFMVASRITLSHAGFSLDFERKMKSIHLVVLFFMASAILRFLPFVTNFITYEHFILCSWLSLITAICIWIKIYGAKLVAPLKRR